MRSKREYAMFARLARGFSFATMSLKPSWSGLTPVASFREGS
jgi:hypothetical protein